MKTAFLAYLYGLIALGGVSLAGIAFVAGFFVRKAYAERLIRTAESKAREILVKAKRESDEVLNRADRESKRYLSRIQSDFDAKMSQQRRELENLKKTLERKEASLEQKDELMDKKEKLTLNRLQEADVRETKIREKETAAESLIAEQREALKKISALNPDEAKQEFLKRLEIESRAEASKIVLEIERSTKDEADKKAKQILSLAIQKCAAEHSMESTVTMVTLPNDEMKGRIIGKDGRNIRAFETLTGVDLVIDDTPQTVVLSAFDGIRREIARLALEELIKDTRIHPARIEEVVQKTKRSMDAMLKEEGEKVLLEANVTNVHPEIVKLLGRLKFRSSYGQNALAHSLEVAFLMSVIAYEMHVDPVLARRAGLLHDIGKAVAHDVEGPHALIGGELARRYGEHPDVVHAIEAHHEDIDIRSLWPMLVQAADAVSASRPGARRESLESYIKRLKALEEIADKHPGVEKSYAIQGGREIRVIVKPDRVPENELPALAREISKKIEENLKYPGQIKVMVIRETRVENLAK